MKILKKISQFIVKLADSYLLKSIREGLMYTLPIILIGSFVLLVLNLPIEGYHTMINNIFGENWRIALTYIMNGTFQVMSITAYIGVSHSLINNSKTMKNDNVEFLIPVILLLGVYFSVVRSDVVISPFLAESTGLFLSLFISIVATLIFIWFYKNRIIKLGHFSFDGERLLSQSIRVLEPAFFTFLTFALFKLVFKEFGVGEALKEFYNTIVAGAMTAKNKVGFAYLSTFVSHVLWTLGIHGNNVLDSFIKDVFVSGAVLGDNIASSHTVADIFTKQFFDVFVYLGGSGSSMCLIFAMLLNRGKDNTRNIAKASFIPGLFNINEILLYGFPVALNPFFMIPFIMTPLVLITITFAAMYFGLVPLAVEEVRWTTPIILGGYVTTNGSINGILIQVLNLIVGILIYLPFVSMYDAYILDRNKQTLKHLNKEINYVITSRNNFIIDRKDEVGFLARSLANDIKNALRYNKNPMHLEYQPQHDERGRIVGCEVLLRWNHEKYGYISPPTIITLADEARISEELGNWIIRGAFKQLSIWNSMGIKNLIMSVNLLASQLQNYALIEVIQDVIDSFHINPKQMGFEITENAAVDLSDDTKLVLKSLKDLEVKLSIDDFGMGHSSLLYIKNFFIDTVKLDGSLVKDITSDVKSQEIVYSIANLCNMLELTMLAEAVETDAQREKLLGLGCKMFQGYLYSPALKPDVFVEYYNKVRKEFAEAFTVSL